MKKFGIFGLIFLVCAAPAFAGDVISCSDGAYLWKSGSTTYLNITNADAVKQFRRKGHLHSDYIEDDGVLSIQIPWDKYKNAFVATLNDSDVYYSFAFKRLYAYRDGDGLKVVLNAGSYPGRGAGGETYLTDWWFGGCRFH